MKNFDYLILYDLIDKNKIIKINNFIENNYDSIEDEKDSATNINNDIKKTSQVKLIRFKKLKHLINDTLEMALLINNENFGYNLFSKNDYDNFLLSKYSHKNKSKYDYHTDGARVPHYDTKLSFIINVSLETYEGGKFMIHNNDEYEIKEFTKPGNAILFKSYLNHKVTPVTKGERRSLTYFMKGPKFI